MLSLLHSVCSQLIQKHLVGREEGWNRNASALLLPFHPHPMEFLLILFHHQAWHLLWLVGGGGESVAHHLGISPPWNRLQLAWLAVIYELPVYNGSHSKVQMFWRGHILGDSQWWRQKTAGNTMGVWRKNARRLLHSLSRLSCNFFFWIIVSINCSLALLMLVVPKEGETKNWRETPLRCFWACPLPCLPAPLEDH